MTQHSALGTQHSPEQNHPLWFLSFTCFMILYQIFWVVRVLQLPHDLQQQISLSVPLEVFVSILIVTFFTYGLRALIFNRSWAMRYTIGVFCFQMGYSVLRIIVFAEADYDRQRLLFLIIVFSIVCGLLMLSKLIKHLHKPTKGENSYDHKPQA